MEDDYPLVSILIPLYNHEKFVLDCLESVKNEGYPSLELLILDDGSDDESLAIASGWLESNSKHFLKSNIFTQKNQGVVKTLNKLVSLASGDYLLPLASDDILIQNTIGKRVKVLRSDDKILAVFSDSMPIDEFGVKLADSSMEYLHYASKSAYCKRVTPSLILEWGICGAVLLAKREAWDPKKGVGPYPENLEFEDRWFYLMLASMEKIKFIDDIVSKYRVLNSSLSRNPVIDNQVDAIFEVKSKFKGLNYVLIELVHRVHLARKSKSTLKSRFYYVIVYVLIRRFFRYI